MVESNFMRKDVFRVTFDEEDGDPYPLVREISGR